MRTLLRWACVGAAALVASPTLAQQEPGWIADPRTGCLVWNFNPNPNETIRWSGTCPNMSRAEGQGVLQWLVDGAPTERFEGEMREGKYNGHGKVFLEDELIYDGEFKDSLPHGEGTYYAEEGVYSGTWRNGCFREGERRAALGVTEEECGFR